MKIQCTEWKKIFVNHVFDKGLLFKIYSHQGNADQNHNEISAHNFYNGYYQNDKRE